MTKFTRFLVIATVSSVALVGATVSSGAAVSASSHSARASAERALAKKTIHCYKGNAVKTETATAPKCPAGWTTTKPKPKAKTVAFTGSYTGTISLLFNSGTVTVNSVTGKGTGTDMAGGTLTGSGEGTSLSAYCDPFEGSGSLAGAGSELKLTVTSSSSQQACVASGTTSGVQSPPASVSVTGVAKVTGGTGKWVGASGTLKFTGSFSVTNSTAGSTESDAFSATFTGTLTVTP